EHVVDARRGIVDPPTEHAHLPPGFVKPRDDAPAKPSGAPRDEDQFTVVHLAYLLVTSSAPAVSLQFDTWRPGDVTSDRERVPDGAAMGSTCRFLGSPFVLSTTIRS